MQTDAPLLREWMRRFPRQKSVLPELWKCLMNCTPLPKTLADKFDDGELAQLIYLSGKRHRARSLMEIAYTVPNLYCHPEITIKDELCFRKAILRNKTHKVGFSTRIILEDAYSTSEEHIIYTKISETHGCLGATKGWLRSSEISWAGRSSLTFHFGDHHDAVLFKLQNADLLETS